MKLFKNGHKTLSNYCLTYRQTLSGANTENHYVFCGFCLAPILFLLQIIHTIFSLISINLLCYNKRIIIGGASIHGF